jgi:hypothetical protein
VLETKCDALLSALLSLATCAATPWWRRRRRRRRERGSSGRGRQLLGALGKPSELAVPQPQWLHGHGHAPVHAGPRRVPRVQEAPGSGSVEKQHSNRSQLDSPSGRILIQTRGLDRRFYSYVGQSITYLHAQYSYSSRELSPWFNVVQVLVLNDPAARRTTPPACGWTPRSTTSSNNTSWMKPTSKRLHQVWQLSSRCSRSSRLIISARWTPVCHQHRPRLRPRGARPPRRGGWSPKRWSSW